MNKKEFYLENKNKIEQKISNARTKIMVEPKTVFMSNVILSLPMIVSMDLDIPTMGTDGKNVMYDPEFVMELPYDELIFVVCHEGLHNLFLHTDPTRHKLVVDNNTEFNHMIFNIAGDVVINAMLCTLGVGKCPEKAIKSDRYGNVELNINGKTFEYKEAHKMSVDAIYRDIISKVPRLPSGGSSRLKGGSLTGNDVIGGERLEVKQEGKNKSALDEIGKGTPEDIKELEQTIRQQWVQNKQRGVGEKWFNEIIDGYLKPKVNWKNELRAFITPEIATYETFSRRNRNLAHYEDTHDLIFPGEMKEGVEVIVNFDTSGSISKTELQYFLGELDNMFRSFTKDTLTVKIMLSHTKVYYFEKLKDIKDFSKIKIQSGGTSHLDVFEKASKDKIRAMVCFTDCETTFPKKRPKNINKVLVLSTTNIKAPKEIGKTIHIDLKNL